MRYRAELQTKEEIERPIQIFGDTLEQMEIWGRNMLASRPDAKVCIYEQVEQLVRMFGNEGSETKSAA